MDDIRARVVARVAKESATRSDDNPLLHDGYVYSMVLQHEVQHNETMSADASAEAGRPVRRAAAIHASHGAGERSIVGRWFAFPAGPFGSARTIAPSRMTTSVRHTRSKFSRSRSTSSR